VKKFHADGGSEYTPKKFAEYLTSEGIINVTTTPYTAQSNEVGKRANCTIMERARCMLDDAGYLKTFWAFDDSVAVMLYGGVCSSNRVCAGVCEGVSIVLWKETCLIDIWSIDD
jgi:hypothetical protein